MPQGGGGAEGAGVMEAGRGRYKRSANWMTWEHGSRSPFAHLCLLPFCPSSNKRSPVSAKHLQGQGADRRPALCSENCHSLRHGAFFSKAVISMCLTHSHHFKGLWATQEKKTSSSWTPGLKVGICVRQTSQPGQWMESGDPGKPSRTALQGLAACAHLGTAFHDGEATSGDSEGERMTARMLTADCHAPAPWDLMS